MVNSAPGTAFKIFKCPKDLSYLVFLEVSNALPGSTKRTGGELLS